MPSPLKKWTLFLGLLYFQCCKVYGFSGNGDSLKLEINASYFSGSYVEIPVTMVSSGNVFAVDFAFRYDANRLVFDDVVNAMPGLQYLYYLNPNDSMWRFTSYMPSGFQSGTSVCHLRFFTLSNEACAYDFSLQEGYVNGDSCVMDIQGCMDNLGGTEIPSKPNILAYPNPFNSELKIMSDASTAFCILDSNGNPKYCGLGNATVLTSDWPSGFYVLQFNQGNFQFSRPVLKIN